jgi:hypothetical protein
MSFDHIWLEMEGKRSKPTKRLNMCVRCELAPAVTQAFSKITVDDAGDFDVYDEDGNVAYVFTAAMLAAIRAHDTGESPGTYVVKGFCSTHCFMAVAASENL